MRYRLLETVREYALHHLEQSHEAAAVRRSHLRWCRQLAEAWDAAFFGPGQAARLAGLAAELDNLRDGPGLGHAALGSHGERRLQAWFIYDGLPAGGGVALVLDRGRHRPGGARAGPHGLAGVRTAPRAQDEPGDPGARTSRSRRAAPSGDGAEPHLAFVGGDFAEVEARLRESLPRCGAGPATSEAVR